MVIVFANYFMFKADSFVEHLWLFWQPANGANFSFNNVSYMMRK